jgi:hypothetical protein
MLSTRTLGFACSVAVFVCLMAAPAFAQPSDKRTLFTFSGPVAMPGITLPAGQSLFRLADPITSGKLDRHSKGECRSSGEGGDKERESPGRGAEIVGAREAVVIGSRQWRTYE